MSSELFSSIIAGFSAIFGGGVMFGVALGWLRTSSDEFGRVRTSSELCSELCPGLFSLGYCWVSGYIRGCAELCSELCLVGCVAVRTCPAVFGVVFEGCAELCSGLFRTSSDEFGRVRSCIRNCFR
jgi:hypothetical protein